MSGEDNRDRGSAEQRELDMLGRLALISMPRISPTRARWLLSSERPAEVVTRLREGRLPQDLGQAPPGITSDLVGQWQASLRERDAREILADHQRRGIGVLTPLDPQWPFADDPEPPVMLFYKGDLARLASPRAVAVVGTRRCTTVGRTVAYELGQGLAAASVSVVSGLALGVDGAAHRGALDRGTQVIGVVGSGLDVVYPGGNRALWEQVAEVGLLLSEAPAGAKPARWRFPARNRLIAALSIGVVVVESHARGGALLTVDEAVDRGLAVLAVPGSVLSPASDGTNQLLFDGAAPARNAADVLGHLGLSDTGSSDDRDGHGDGARERARDSGGGDDRSGDRDPSDLHRLILREADVGPVHLDVLVHAAARPTAQVLSAVQKLVASGQVELDGSTVSRR